MDIKINLNDIEMKKVDQVKFDILTQKEIKENSVCVINETKLLGLNSVYDYHMGAYMKDNKWFNCITCSETLDCPGHFGHIELNIPVCHPLYLEYIKFLKFKYKNSSLSCISNFISNFVILTSFS